MSWVLILCGLVLLDSATTRVRLNRLSTRIDRVARLYEQALEAGQDAGIVKLPDPYRTNALEHATLTEDLSVARVPANIEDVSSLTLMRSELALVLALAAGKLKDYENSAKFGQLALANKYHGEYEKWRERAEELEEEIQARE